MSSSDQLGFPQVFLGNTKLHHRIDVNAFRNYNNLFFLVCGNVQDYMKIYILKTFYRSLNFIPRSI